MLKQTDTRTDQQKYMDHLAARIAASNDSAWASGSHPNTDWTKTDSKGRKMGGGREGPAPGRPDDPEAILPLPPSTGTNEKQQKGRTEQKQREEIQRQEEARARRKGQKEAIQETRSARRRSGRRRRAAAAEGRCPGTRIAPHGGPERGVVWLLTSEEAMRVFREPESSDYGRDALAFTLGASGASSSAWCSRGVRRRGRWAGAWAASCGRGPAAWHAPAPRAPAPHGGGAGRTDAAGGCRPGRLPRRRGARGAGDRRRRDQPRASSSSRARVWAHEEADRATRVANGVAGVETVVNRMGVEAGGRPAARTPAAGSRRPAASARSTTDARVGGMGRRRQGRETDPDRPDDSQAMELDALARADRDQWEEEGYAYRNPQQTERPEVQRAEPHGLRPGRARQPGPARQARRPHAGRAAAGAEHHPRAWARG